MADLLVTGSSALLAFQRSLDTTGHNIANVNTEGYSRQRVLLESRLGQQLGAGYFGSGVQTVGVERLQDRFVFDRMLESLATGARLDRFQVYTSRLDQTLSDPATGLSGPLQKFYDGLQALSADPSSTAARQSLLGSAQTLATRFQSLQDQLDAMSRDVNSRLTQAVNDVNTFSAQIAQLNTEIVRATGQSGGQPPNDLLDQREQLLTQLAQRIGVTTALQDDGSLNVYTANGQALVVGSTAGRLAALPDPYDAQRLDLAVVNAAGTVRIGSSASGGEIGGLLDFRREVLDPAMGQLGTLAVGLARTVNEQHAAGMDLYGDLGGAFFTTPSPESFAHVANTGGASLAVGYGALAQLTGDNYTLSFDGVNYSAVNDDTGSAVAMTGTGTIADPFVFDGLTVSVSGATAAGDRFLLRSTASAAGQLDVLIRDPARIAAASPVRSAASVSNLGTAAIAAPGVTDAQDPALLATATITFLDANRYSINGGPAVAYASGGTIALNGWTTRISGVPAAGDTFTVQATAAGSSDNGNARLLGALSTVRVLDGGAASVHQGYATLVAQAGGAAQQAQLQGAAQDAIHTRIVAERDSVSGVNLDEEAANLLRFQQAYQAAAQVIAVSDALFQTLLAAVRR